MRLTRYSLLFGLLFGAQFFGETAIAGETLKESLAAAYNNNPTLAAQRAQLRATDEGVPQALSGWRPTLRGNAATGFRRINPDRSSPTGIASTASRAGTQKLQPRTASAEINQPLFRGGRTLAATRSAENAVFADRSQLKSVEQTVLLEGATAFMDVYRDQAVLELQIRNEQRLARQLEATRDRFQVGEVTRTDVFQAEARLAQATAERVSAEGALERSRATYKNVIGMAPGALEKPEIPRDIPADREQAINTAIDDNPDVLSAQFNERSALDNIDQVRGELFPEINLVGRAQTDDELALKNTVTHRLEALVNLSVPLYQSGAVYSRLRQQKQVAAQARRVIDQAQRNAVEAATQAWSNLETARAEIKSFEKAKEANAVALDGVEQEAQVGARTVLDILDAEQELVNSQVSLVRAQRNEAVAIFELQTAIGALTARKLELPVEYYDPEKHYNEVRGLWFGGSSSGDVSDEDFLPPD